MANKKLKSLSSILPVEQGGTESNSLQAGEALIGNDDRAIALGTFNGGGTVTGDFVPLNEKGIADGVATLDSTGLIPSWQIPPIDGGTY